MRPYGKVTGFSVTFFESIAGGTEPKVINPQFDQTDVGLARFNFAGNCGETPAGTFGSTEMYDYQVVLSSPFHAQAGVKYWASHRGIAADLSGLGDSCG